MIHRRIPRVGTALLLLGGCYSSRPIGGGGSGGGGGGGGGGGAGGGTSEAIALAYCEQLDACEPAYVDLYFGGVEGCAEQHAYWLDYDAGDITAAYGAVCGDAFLAYYECLFGTITGCSEDPADPYTFTFDYDAYVACGETLLDVCPALELRD